MKGKVKKKEKNSKYKITASHMFLLQFDGQ